MKTRKLLFVATLLTLAITACKKETKYGTSITPLNNVLNALPASPALEYFRDEPVILAMQFKSAKDGRITEFGIRAGKGTYKVSLWDSSALNLISSTSITASDSTVFLYKDINDINIVSNKTYIISMFNQTAEGGSGTHVIRGSVATVFPFTLGDITLEGSYYKTTTNASAFPAGFLYKNLITGIADFKFEPKL